MNTFINMERINQIQINYDNIPLAVFLIGSNGSGKSTLRNYLNLSDIQTNIDPDVLNRIFKIRYPDSYLIEAAKQALTMYRQGILNGLNICIESTLAGRGTIERIKQAKANGYFVTGYLVGLNDVDLNIKRIEQRVAKGGHDIPEATIKRRYVESIDNFLKINQLFDEIHVIDNSNTEYSLQFSKYDNKLVQYTPNIEAWVVEILQQLRLE